MRDLILSLLAGTLAAAAPAADDARTDRAARGEAALARLIEGRVAGKPVDCLILSDLRTAQVIPGTALVYRVGSRLYVNRPRESVGQLDLNDILVTRPFGAQLCRLDMVDRVDRNSGFWRGFVSLGEFVPYDRAR